MASTFASHANVKTDFAIVKQSRLTSTFASHAKLLLTQANYAKDQAFTGQVSLGTHPSSREIHLHIYLLPTQTNYAKDQPSSTK